MAGFALYRADCVPVLETSKETSACNFCGGGPALSWCKEGVRCSVMGSKYCFSPVIAQTQLAFCADLRYQTAMSDESIENLARKLADSVPEGLRSMREDLENNFRSVLRASLSKLDLVTRDEFEVQEAVLQRTREKLEALEARLEAADKKDS